MLDETSASTAAAEARTQAQALLRRAANFEAAAVAEEQVSRVLASLRPRLMSLDDRRLPGSNRANIDHIAVGPRGIFVIDTKAWSAPHVRDGSLWDGATNCDDDVCYVESIARRLDVTLAELGDVPPVVPILVFVGEAPASARLGRVRIVPLSELSALLNDGSDEERRLTPRAVDAVAQVLIQCLPPMGEPEAALVDVLPLPRMPAPRVADPQLSLLDAEDLHLAEFESVLRMPVEDWMIFLDPSQRKLVERTYNGPACIRGAAGTGKTAIALHRAARLASTRAGNVLFVTFVRTLAPTLRHLYTRLAPGTESRLEFTNIHGWATQYLQSHGIPYPIDHGDRAWWAAWNDWKAAGFGADLHVPRDYLKEEIDCVIKGRGLLHLDAYLALDRVGRRTPLNHQQRIVVWELYTRYLQQQRDRRVVDYNDLLSMALAYLQVDPEPPTYAAVLVDEVQDLTLIGVQLLHFLAGGDTVDGLTLIGDGQQSVYPGGFRLAEAGVDVRGRSTVLRRNYRNTSEILACASRLISGTAFTDLEDDITSRDEITSDRHGARPYVLEFPTSESHDEALVEHVKSLLVHAHVWPGDVALLASTKRAVQHYLGLLHAARVPAIDLRQHNGVPSAQVRVGTYQRSKGLEFKHVLLARIDADMLPLASSQADGKAAEVQAERRELLKRQLFVAMTRARDSLWIGGVGVNALHALSGG
ncbi:MAG: nuclease [Frankiales bacterium]|nr:nuclease [Frankiales bacterium]